MDDPLEAGEPFLDVNGNGKRQVTMSGEPFIDLGWQRQATRAPADGLWAQLWPTRSANGTLAEPITFDYTNGQARFRFIKRCRIPDLVGGVRNLESQARQLYARHLYCLMLLLVDENYIAPWDENDPQIVTWLENTTKAIEAALIAAPYNVPTAAGGAAGQGHRHAQAHVPHDRPMGDQLRRHARRGRDHDAVRVRREPVGRLGLPRWHGRRWCAEPN